MISKQFSDAITMTVPSYSGHFGFLYFFIVKFAVIAKLYYTPTCYSYRFVAFAVIIMVENCHKKYVL